MASYTGHIAVALLMGFMAAATTAQTHSVASKDTMPQPIATSCIGNDRIQVYLAPKPMYTWLDAQATCFGQLAATADISADTVALTSVLRVRTGCLVWRSLHAAHARTQTIGVIAMPDSQCGSHSHAIL
jgi:hypothetical protein